MTRLNQSKRSLQFARPALGLALALGVVAGGMAAAPALAHQKDSKQKTPAAPKIKMTKPFEPVYGAKEKALDGGYHDGESGRFEKRPRKIVEDKPVEKPD